MSAVAFAPQAHRQRQLAALLCERAYTLQEAAGALEVSVDNLEHVMRRLPAALEVQELGDEVERRYRILYPRGRVCAAAGCGTLLRRSNPAERCEAHGGGSLEPSVAPATLPRVDGAALQAAREARGLTRRQLAARVKLTARFVSQLERGRRPVTPEVARRLAKVVGRSVVRR